MKEIRNRRSIRLKGYDYSSSGAYFVTICTHNRESLFGEIVRANGIRPEMISNEYGEIVWDEWIKTKQLRLYVELDVWVVMPNHFHGIIILSGVGARYTRVYCVYPVSYYGNTNVMLKTIR